MGWIQDFGEGGLGYGPPKMEPCMWGAEERVQRQKLRSSEMGFWPFRKQLACHKRLFHSIKDWMHL